VKRGESALAPILSTQLPYRRELLFNERKLPDHPVAALRFANETGLVLEHGPVTVLEDGEYRGEAIIPFTKDGAEVYVAFAVELGIKAGVTTTFSTETAGVHLLGALLDIKEASITRTEYRLENSTGVAQAVTIEHPIGSEAELVDMPEPEARTLEYYRWTVACPARRVTTFKVVERRYTSRTEFLLKQSYAGLKRYLKEKWLDAEALARIKAVLDEREAMARNEEEIKSLQSERADVYNREEQLRKNMAALGSGGDEGTLRRRTVTKLEQCEERIAAIEARVSALQEENIRWQAKLEAILSGITEG
jgi:hypothetical protein